MEQGAAEEDITDGQFEEAPSSGYRLSWEKQRQKHLRRVDHRGRSVSEDIRSGEWAKGVIPKSKASKAKAVRWSESMTTQVRVGGRFSEEGEDSETTGESVAAPLASEAVTSSEFAETVSPPSSPNSRSTREHQIHMNPLPAKKELSKKERREKVEAEFKTATEKWDEHDDSEHSDDELECYPFEEPDLPTNVVFKNPHKRRARSSPSSTPNAIAPNSPKGPLFTSLPPPPLFKPQDNSVLTLLLHESRSSELLDSSDARKIKGGTLHKLVERLTDHLELGRTWPHF